jgi:para-nitrobenzyl esterase
MVGYLCDFAKTGNPNGGDRPLWQVSSPEQKQVLRMGEGETAMDTPSNWTLIKTMLTNKAVGE